MIIYRNSYRRILLVIGALAAAGLVLLGAAEYTSRSDFCVNCHEMNPIYKAWQSSTHNSVQCMQCHSDPGLIALVKTKLQALKEVYRHITKTYHQPITIDSDTAAFTDRCLRCHSDIKGRGAPHNPNHFAASVNCADCHQWLVHNPDTNRKLPTGDVCIRCHGQAREL